MLETVQCAESSSTGTPKSVLFLPVLPTLKDEISVEHSNSLLNASLSSIMSIREASTTKDADGNRTPPIEYTVVLIGTDQKQSLVSRWPGQNGHEKAS